MENVNKVAENPISNAVVVPVIQLMKHVLEEEEKHEILGSDLRPMQNLLLDIKIIIQNQPDAAEETLKIWLQLLHNSLAEAKSILRRYNSSQRQPQRCLDCFMCKPERLSKRVNVWKVHFNYLFQGFQRDFSIFVTVPQNIHRDPTQSMRALKSIEGQPLSAGDQAEEPETETEESETEESDFSSPSEFSSVEASEFSSVEAEESGHFLPAGAGEAEESEHFLPAGEAEESEAEESEHFVPAGEAEESEAEESEHFVPAGEAEESGHFLHAGEAEEAAHFVPSGEAEESPHFLPAGEAEEAGSEASGQSLNASLSRLHSIAIADSRNISDRNELAKESDLSSASEFSSIEAEESEHSLKRSLLRLQPIAVADSGNNSDRSESAEEPDLSSASEFSSIEEEESEAQKSGHSLKPSLSRLHSIVVADSGNISDKSESAKESDLSPASEFSSIEAEESGHSLKPSLSGLHSIAIADSGKISDRSESAEESDLSSGEAEESEAEELEVEHLLPAGKAEESGHLVPEGEVEESGHFLPAGEAEEAAHFIPPEESEAGESEVVHFLPAGEAEESEARESEVEHFLPAGEAEESGHLVTEGEAEDSEHFVASEESESGHFVAPVESEDSGHFLPASESKESQEEDSGDFHSPDEAEESQEEDSGGFYSADEAEDSEKPLSTREAEESRKPLSADEAEESRKPLSTGEAAELVQPLSKDEAWMLFRSIAFKDNPVSIDIEKHARNIVDECKCVPLGIALVASAMIGKSTVDEWRDSLSSIKNVHPSSPDIDLHPRSDPNLQRIIRWSYDSLPNAIAKNCFLYCAMYDENELINVETLVQMWIAEGLVRSRQGSHLMDMAIGFSYLNLLLDRCLFQNASLEHSNWPPLLRHYPSPYWKQSIKVHNAIRSMAIYIGEEEENCVFKGGRYPESFLEIHRNQVADCKRISGSIYFTRMPSECTCPILVSLFLSGLSSGFPASLTSLKVLVLDGRIRRGIMTIGQLKQLEFLTLRSCNWLRSLPSKIGELKNLKYLNLELCSRLRVIPREISQLTSLSTLKADYMEAESEASIWSLNGLANLTTLRIRVRVDVPQEGRTSSGIQVGIMGTWLEMRHLFLWFQTTPLGTDYVMEDLPGDMQNMRKLQSLVMLRYHGLSLPDFTCKFQLLEYIELWYCPHLRDLSPLERLPNLKSLVLADLHNLKEMGLGKSGGASGFYKLNELVVAGLSNLESLGGPLGNDVWSEAILPNLRILAIQECSSLHRLPKGLEKLRNLSLIYGDENWWQGIIWEDDNMKSSLQKLYKEWIDDYPKRKSVAMMERKDGDEKEELLHFNNKYSKRLLKDWTLFTGYSGVGFKHRMVFVLFECFISIVVCTVLILYLCKQNRVYAVSSGYCSLISRYRASLRTQAPRTEMSEAPYKPTSTKRRKGFWHDEVILF